MPSLHERDDDSSYDDSSDDDSTLANTEEVSDSLFTPYGINDSCKAFETRIAKILVAEGGLNMGTVPDNTNADDLSESDLSGDTFIIDDYLDDESLSVTSGNNMAS